MSIHKKFHDRWGRLSALHNGLPFCPPLELSTKCLALLDANEDSHTLQKMIKSLRKPTLNNHINNELLLQGVLHMVERIDWKQIMTILKQHLHDKEQSFVIWLLLENHREVRHNWVNWTKDIFCQLLVFGTGSKVISLLPENLNENGIQVEKCLRINGQNNAPRTAQRVVVAFAVQKSVGPSWRQYQKSTAGGPHPLPRICFQPSICYESSPSSQVRPELLSPSIQISDAIFPDAFFKKEWKNYDNRMEAFGWTLVQSNKKNSFSSKL